MQSNGQEIKKKSIKFDHFGQTYLKDLVKDSTKTHLLFEAKVKADMARMFKNNAL